MCRVTHLRMRHVTQIPTNQAMHAYVYTHVCVHTYIYIYGYAYPYMHTYTTYTYISIYEGAAGQRPEPYSQQRAKSLTYMDVSHIYK